MELGIYLFYLERVIVDTSFREEKRLDTSNFFNIFSFIFIFFILERLFQFVT